MGLATRLSPLVLASCVLAAGAAAQGAGLSADERSAREVAGLIEALGASGCRFQRNGRWYPAADAKTHLRRKYDWARKRGMQGTAEQFIEQAATRSSLSGKPYRVRCADGREGPAADWFMQVLARLRAAESSRSSR